MPKPDSDLLIGFVGQGYVGGSYADDFERRGFRIVRYSLEPTHAGNKDRIRECDIVFICLPTPTTPKGFDDSLVEEGLKLVRDGATAVIKSTILPGTTKRLQEAFPNAILLFSPEFLSAATAGHEAAHPFSNIIGLPVRDSAHIESAELMHRILPKAAYALTCDSGEAEIIKYAHNTNGYIQVVLANLLYDIAQTQGADWDVIQQAIEADPFMRGSYYHPVHKSGRGAGGGCFIKDFAALRDFYAKRFSSDTAGIAVLSALEQKNTELLLNSGKDLELLKATYGTSLPRTT